MTLPFLSSVTRIADLAAHNFATTALPRERWDTGDYVVARTLDTRDHLSAIELPGGAAVAMLT